MTSALLILLILPSLLMVILSFPSLAAGLVISSCIVILLHLTKHTKVSIAKIYFITTAISSLWIFANPSSLENSIHAKQLLSIAATLVCGLAITSSFKFEQKPPQKAIRVLFWTLLIIGLAGAFDFFRPGNYKLLNSPIFPFSESSHFAIAFTPIACCFALISSNRVRLLTCFTSFVLAISIPSLTLLVGTLAISIIALSARQIIKFITITCTVGVTLIYADPSHLEYFVIRAFASETENISRLVYTQGWESMISAFQVSNGLGVGYQNLGIEPSGQATFLLETLTGSQLNRSDGSFLAAKLIGEFGILGIIGVIYLATLSIRSGLALRIHIREQISPASESIPLCFTYTLLLELFFRGTGYFSPSLLITLFFIFKAIKVLKSTTHMTQTNSSHENIAR